eukprot:6351600-Pyramimonas_sp.AAC.1
MHAAFRQMGRRALQGAVQIPQMWPYKRRETHVSAYACVHLCSLPPPPKTDDDMGGDDDAYDGDDVDNGGAADDGDDAAGGDAGEKEADRDVNDQAD